MQTDRTRKVHACVSLAAVLAVAFCMTALPAMAAEEGSSDGSFVLQNDESLCTGSVLKSGV